MNNIKERIKIFSGAQLKYIAFLSMLIDHTNKALIYPILDGGALNRLSDFFDMLDEQMYVGFSESEKEQLCDYFDRIYENMERLKNAAMEGQNETV